MTNVLISIVVPVYNVENVLDYCVDSILAQTFSDFELILVNEGLTDGSGSICDEYAKKKSFLTYSMSHYIFILVVVCIISSQLYVQSRIKML